MSQFKKNETVGPSSAHYCIDIVVLSSDRCRIGTVTPPSACSNGHYMALQYRRVEKSISKGTKPVTCRRKHKLSFSYVQKEEKMGFNLVQKTFVVTISSKVMLV